MTAYYKYLFFLFSIFMLIAQSGMHAQNSKSSEEENFIILVQFTDKNDSPYSIDAPLVFLSQRAIDRRTKHGLSITKHDFPVNPHYLDSLRFAGASIMFTSRWLNTATIKVDSIAYIKVKNLSFVNEVESVYKASVTELNIPFANEITSNQFTVNDYGESFRQINMLNGDFLHQKGYTGEGVLIAVIDAGFTAVDHLSAFKHLRSDNKIKGTWNFIDINDSVYHLHSHGTYVLSCIAAKLPGKIIGTAPDAQYLLLRSEDAATEYIIEEDSWIAAAEYADSAGADVINSSLGYNKYDNPDMDHAYSDMNGNSTRVTKGADFAAAKGIVVSTSAGNKGLSAWRHITAPADGDSVLTVGAVDDYGRYAAFSSIGPTYDGRIKPDVVALGNNAVVAALNDGDIGRASGTSLSSPIIAGLVACLIQAFPDRSNMEIIDAIQKSAHLYARPDAFMGYGIPDFKIAYEILSLKETEVVRSLKLLELYPVPFKNRIVVSFFSRDEGKVNLSITNLLGQEIFREEYDLDKREVHKVELNLDHVFRPGVYVLSISTGRQSIKRKILSY